MVSLVPRGPRRQVGAQSPGSPIPGKVYEGAGLPFVCCPQAQPLGVHNMFCPLCPGTRAQSPSWSKFGRGREGWEGTGCLRAVTHTPVPGPEKGRDKRLGESQKQRRERDRETLGRAGQSGGQSADILKDRQTDSGHSGKSVGTGVRGRGPTDRRGDPP